MRPLTSVAWAAAALFMMTTTSLADVPATMRSATGTVGLVQSRVPDPSTRVVASFFDAAYSESDPCPPAPVGGCTVRTCPTGKSRASSRTTRPSAGVIRGSVDQQAFRLDPTNDSGMVWYQAGDLPASGTGQPGVRGGQTLRVDAAGDPLGVPAFSGQVTAPVFVSLTSPASPQLKMGAPFTVAWSPASPNGVLRVQLVAVRGASQTTAICEFAGNLGAGTVPVGVIGLLSPGNLVFSVDAISATVVTAGAYTVTINVDDSVASGVAHLTPN
jgi:hypothetical protein